MNHGEARSSVDDEELHELLGAYALDAVDELEAARVERLLARDPQAAREVARYEDAIAALVDSHVAVEPPALAWEGVRARTAGTRTAAPRAASGTGAVGTRSGAGARTRRPFLLFAAAAMALVVVGIGALFATRDGSPSPADEFATVVTAPGAKTVTLAGPAGEARVVMAEDGTGWLDARTLAPLADDRVYQLWALEEGDAASMGVVTVRDGFLRFQPPAGMQGLALTVEPAPGVAKSSAAPVALVEL